MREKIRGSLLSILTASLILTACSSGTTSFDDYATNEGYLSVGAENDIGKTVGEKNENAEYVGEKISKENIKVGVLFLSDPNEGSGYSYTHDLGIIGMQENLGLSENQIVRKVVDDNDNRATRNAIEACVKEGCNIIFTTSWGYMETTEQMAELFPEVYFSHGTGYLSNGANFTNYFGRIYQARYLSGIVAGLNTKSNKIGYVAAQDINNSEVTGGIDAFAIGVAAVNPDAKIYVKVTNSWYDEVKEEQASRKLLDMGCDVMAQHCDTAYPLTLAQEKGVYGIGYNSDMSKETPDACLTSVIWNWSAYYTSAVEDVINGKWSGENYYGGMAEGLVDITNLAPFCSEMTAGKVEEEKARILSGTFNVFDGELKTNTGEIIGKEGETLSDSEITGSINWYYYNVEVVE